jgi:hypothetical protein
MRALWLIASASLCSCALAQVMPEPQGEYTPIGEVLFSGGESASFSAVRVRAPNMNLSRRTDDSWSGTFDEEVFDVSVTKEFARGVGVTLALDQNDAKGFRVQGQWQGERVRFAVMQDKVSVHTEKMNFDLPRTGESAFGSQGELKLKGAAAALPAEWPQTAFALLSVFE